MFIQPWLRERKRERRERERESVMAGEVTGEEWVKAMALIAIAAASLVAACVMKLGMKVLWRPYGVQAMMHSQGAKRPPYRPYFGNVRQLVALNKAAMSEPMELTHDIIPRVLSHYHHWLQLYGKPLLIWFGWKPRMYVTDPELMKEVLSSKFSHFQKIPPTPDLKLLVGENSLFNSDGETWAHHKRILNPAFHLETLKGMIPTMVECTMSMLTRWNQFIKSGQKEVEMQAEFRSLTRDVISQTAFGSSYAEGLQFFMLQQKLAVLVSEAFHTPYIPGYRFLPTPKNIQRWELDRRMREVLTNLIKSREREKEASKKDGFGKDLLGLMISANRKDLEGSQRRLGMSMEDIMDECKIFYFAGHETTSLLLTWTMMLLGVHTEWQEQAREEVFRVCGSSPPNSDTINNLKLMDMVLNESLRLYPPASEILRKTYKAIRVGDIVVSEGVELVLCFIAVHHDKALWGEDASTFNPNRFTRGAATDSKVLSAFQPFSKGPRVCIGQNLSRMEAKIALTMILQRYSFIISPAYHHAPTIMLTLQPQFGVQVLLQPLEPLPHPNKHILSMSK